MAPSLAQTCPDLCLENIFKRLPLTDLVHSIGLVCKNWYKSRLTELNKRRRLVLVDGRNYGYVNYREVDCSYGTDLIERVLRDDGSPWQTLELLDQIEFNTLILSDGLQTVQFNSSLNNFTNITRLLLIYTCTNQRQIEVVRRIVNVSEHLVTLSLKINFFPNRGNMEGEYGTQEFVNALFDQLNRLNRTVRHLKLSLSFIGKLRFLRERLSCLSHLDTFSIRINNNNRIMDEWIIESLNEYAETVSSIEIHSPLSIVMLFQSNVILTSKFSVLCVSARNRLVPAVQHDYIELRQICENFNLLTKLELKSSFDSMPMTRLARCLSLLIQLVHLVLDFNRIPPVEQPGEWFQEQEQNGEDEQAEPAQQPVIIQVPSVRLLTIRFTSQSHRDTERLSIPEIFPNLQVLALGNWFSQCQDCDIAQRVGGFYDIEEDEPELFGLIEQCKRLTRGPFRRCANLHTVSLGSDTNNLIDLDEL